jgi:hypothetical protein
MSAARRPLLVPEHVQASFLSGDVIMNHSHTPLVSELSYATGLVPLPTCRQLEFRPRLWSREVVFVNAFALDTFSGFVSTFVRCGVLGRAVMLVLFSFDSSCILFFVC